MVSEIVLELSFYIRDRCYKLNAKLDYDEGSETRDRMPREPPLKQVALLPLTISLLESCKYINNQDSKVLSNDIRFMKRIGKTLEEYQAIHDKLKSINQTSS